MQYLKLFEDFKNDTEIISNPDKVNEIIDKIKSYRTRENERKINYQLSLYSTNKSESDIDGVRVGIVNNGVFDCIPFSLEDIQHKDLETFKSFILEKFKSPIMEIMINVGIPYNERTEYYELSEEQLGKIVDIWYPNRPHKDWEKDL
jgi:hypothetical protein